MVHRKGAMDAEGNCYLFFVERTQPTTTSKSGWFDFALKGRNQKHEVFQLPSSEALAINRAF
jgi:hypothetical protein